MFDLIEAADAAAAPTAASGDYLLDLSTPTTLSFPAPAALTGAETDLNAFQAPPAALDEFDLLVAGSASVAAAAAAAATAAQPAPLVLNGGSFLDQLIEDVEMTETPVTSKAPALDIFDQLGPQSSTAVDLLGEIDYGKDVPEVELEAADSIALLQAQLLQLKVLNSTAEAAFIQKSKDAQSKLANFFKVAEENLPSSAQSQEIQQLLPLLQGDYASLAAALSEALAKVHGDHIAISKNDIHQASVVLEDCAAIAEALLATSSDPIVRPGAQLKFSLFFFGLLARRGFQGSKGVSRGPGRITARVQQACPRPPLLVQWLHRSRRRFRRRILDQRKSCFPSLLRST